MDYCEFVNEIAGDLEFYLEDELAGAKIEVRKIEKIQNQSYLGMVVIPRGSNVGISVDLRPFYEKYLEGDYTDALYEICDFLEESLKDAPKNCIDFSEYQNIKGLLYPQIVGYKENEDELSDIPHKVIEDMAVIYRVMMKKESGLMSSFIIRNEMMKKYGITVDQLHADAINEASKSRPFFIKSLSSVLSEAFEYGIKESIDEKEIIYMASNDQCIFGAGVILYPGFFEKAAELIGEDYYILPSSLHECMLVPEDKDVRVNNLLMMVKEINKENVSPEDKLTDSVYHYDRKNHEFRKVM